jgi:threonine/homoserine/homoserine lactone efflux protein
MEQLVPFMGALVVCYLVSRASLAGAKRLVAGWSAIVVAHLASFVLISLFVGLLRAYSSALNWEAPIIYIAPQLIWLGIDLFRSADRSSEARSSARRSAKEPASE